MDDAEYRARRQVLKDRYDELERRHQERLRRFDVTNLPPLHRLREAWENGSMDVAQKRALVSLVIESFVTLPGTKGHFQPSRVPIDRIVWREHVPTRAREAAAATEVSGEPNHVRWRRGEPPRLGGPATGRRGG